MTKRSKTRRSLRGRKKSLRRPDHATPDETAKDGPGDIDVFLDEAIPQQAMRAGATSSRKREAFSTYMEELASVSGLLDPKREREMAVRIQRGRALAVKALKKDLTAAEKYRDVQPSRRSTRLALECERAQKLLAKFNPDRLRGVALARHLEASSIGALGLAIIKRHDPIVYRVIERFTHANLRLVLMVARRYAYHGLMPIEDLVQEGNAGLLKAILRFDPARGYRFSTYATWWLRHAIGRAMSDKGRLIRLPVHMVTFGQNINHTRQILVKRLERLPTNAEIAQEMGCAVDKVELVRESLVDPCPLDVPIDDENGKTFAALMVADETPEVSVWDTLIPEKREQFLREAFEELTPMMRDIIRTRFGLDSDEEVTLQAIGERYRLSRERIRQIQEQGLKRLHQSLARRFNVAV